ncbi:hypothetical protein GCM10018962_77480 [Dactylosporangium matsuzakiense]|uniref:helix-turn-helix domain-containing protein n=1 Tax=Dactylosporangium matsuzakiense TaxID=53360 RepID=UPI0031E87DDE
MSTRWDVERALRGSTLPAPARHVALTIATWCDPDTAAVPARYTPSLTGLADATGLGRSTVARHLDLLESAGWLVRRRPTVADARRRHERTLYRLRVPADLVPERDQPSPAPTPAWSRSDAPLVPERDTTTPRSIDPARPAPLGPPCGKCGPGRLIAADDGTDRVTRCPDCHPKYRRTA